MQKEKLQEFIVPFYKIYASNEIDLYISAFDNNDLYETLIKLLEYLHIQEKNTKKKENTTADKKEEGTTLQAAKSKQVLITPSKKKVTKILITDEATYNNLFPLVHYIQFAKVKYQYLDQSTSEQINQHIQLLSNFGFNVFPIDSLSNSIPKHHLLLLDKWKIKKWCKYLLNLLDAQLNQLEKEKQTIKCRLCDSKIDITEANQHSQICLKNSQTKKKILAMDQELVKLINDSVDMRNKYRKEMNLWMQINNQELMLIVKQNKQIKNTAYKEDIGQNIEDPSPVNNSNSTPTDRRRLRHMVSQTSQEGLKLEEDIQSNSSLQQIDEDSLSNSSSTKLGGSDNAPRIKIERKQKKRVSTQVISNERLPSITSIPRQKLLEESEQKMDQFKKYGDVLKELINYGEKVINANEQTLDIRNEIQLKQMLESLTGVFTEEDEAELNSLVEKFDLHLQERIEVTKKAQKYDQDIKNQSTLKNANPDSQNPGQAKKLAQLQGISGSVRVAKGFNFGSLNKGKSAHAGAQQPGSSEDNKEAQPQEGQEASISSPKPSEEKKEEPKKRMMIGMTGANKKLSEKNKTVTNAKSQFQQGSHSGSSEQIDSMLSTQSSMNMTTSASIDSVTSTPETLPKSKSEDIQSIVTPLTPVQNVADSPKEEAPKKPGKSIMTGKLSGNLKAKLQQRAEGISNSIDSPQNTTPKPETTASSSTTTDSNIQKTSQVQLNDTKSNTVKIENKPLETQKQVNNLTLATQQKEDNTEQNQIAPRPKLSPKKKFLKRNASNILEEDEEFEDDDTYFNSSSKKQEVIQEDEDENENENLVTPTNNKNQKELKQELPELGKQSSFNKLLNSTPMNPRKLESTSGTSSQEKLNNFKNLRQHSKKNGEGCSSNLQQQELKLENKLPSQKNETLNQQTEQQNQDKKNPSLEEITFESNLNGINDSKVIYEENESHSSVHFSLSTIGKVSETNLPSDVQLNLINNINGVPSSLNQSLQSLSLSQQQSDQQVQFQQSIPSSQSPSKDISKNRQIKQQLQNFEQITPNKKQNEPFQQKQTELLNSSSHIQNQQQKPCTQDAINNGKQNHLQTQESSTEKVNGTDNNIDNQPKSRILKEQKCFKDEESPEEKNCQKSFDYDNILAEDNLVHSSNVITAPSDSTSTKKKKKKSRSELNNARLEESENLISDDSDLDHDENNEDDNNKQRNLKYFSSSSNSDESDGETSQMIASLLQESALGSGSDSDDSDKPAFMKIIKDKEQIKLECQKSRFSFITPLIGSEDSEDQGNDYKNSNDIAAQNQTEMDQQVQYQAQVDEEKEHEKITEQENTSNQVVTVKKYSNEPSIQTYYPDLPDFSKYSIITEKGFNSDSEFVKLDTQKKKDQMSIGFKDFEFIKMLGKGAYGGVYLVKKQKSDDLFAMKVIDCSGKLDKKYLETLQSEKNVFEVITGDWVVKAFYSFVHENYLCFVLEYMMGGDFNQILGMYTALDQWIVQIYLAELVLAIEYLHSMNIVHRDLKPDNMLIDQTGHLKLADFGLSEVGFQRQLNKHINGEEDLTQPVGAELMAILEEGNKENDFKIEIQVEGMKNNDKEKEQPKRIVGTPDYIAPEIITGESTNNKSLDWWSMGIIMYEFLVGLPPFNADSIEEIFDNIKNLRMEWPEIGDIEQEEDKISPEAADLIKQLLNPNYKERLGAKGAQEIKEHPFFKNIKWNKLRNNKPPIQPKSKQTEEAKEKREKDKQQMQQFLNSLNIKQGVKGKTDEVSKKLQEGLKALERPDLVAQQNIEEAQQLIEEKLTKKGRIQKKIDQCKKIEMRLTGETYDFDPVKALDDYLS